MSFSIASAIWVEIGRLSSIAVARVVGDPTIPLRWFITHVTNQPPEPGDVKSESGRSRGSRLILVFELHHLSAQEQWDWLHRGEITPLELVTHYLERIARLNAELGAFTTVTADAALERARSLESLVPKTAALWGLPSGDKDLVRRAGVRTTFGSRLFENFVPDRSDELVELLDAAGAISLGKTNAPEFGMPSYTESLVAPPARNPWRLELGAGGSSGGAAVAVSAGLLPVAPGSDGGGSIRIPAAATGLVGFKPG